MTTIQKILFILTPTERKSVVILLFLTAIGTGLDTIGVAVIFPVMILMTQVNLAAHYPSIQPIFEFLGNPSQELVIRMAMLFLVGIFLVKNLFGIWLAWRNFNFTSGVQVELSQRLFSAYMHQPYTFHLQRNSSRLSHNINQAVIVVAAITSSLTIVTEGLVLLSVATLLLLVEPLGAIIVVMVFGAAAWIFHYSTRARLSKWGTARLYHDRLKGQHMSQGFGGVKDVKMLGRESNFLAQYYLHSTQSAQIGKYQNVLQQIPRMWLEFLTVTGLLSWCSAFLVKGTVRTRSYQL
jgi:ABC-type bacteriocin/lantibiotic exporter with double-glycine peptidase domain